MRVVAERAPATFEEAAESIKAGCDWLAGQLGTVEAERDLAHAEGERLREVIAILRAYIGAPEGDGPVRYIEALALADEALGDDPPSTTETAA